MRDKTKSKKAFREFLNRQDVEHRQKIIKDNLPIQLKYKNGRYHQRTRLYGDYLYNQDRVMFDVNYQEWLKGDII